MSASATEVTPRRPRVSSARLNVVRALVVMSVALVGADVTLSGAARSVDAGPDVAFLVWQEAVGLACAASALATVFTVARWPRPSAVALLTIAAVNVTVALLSVHPLSWFDDVWMGGAALALVAAAVIAMDAADAVDSASGPGVSGAAAASGRGPAWRSPRSLLLTAAALAFAVGTLTGREIDLRQPDFADPLRLTAWSGGWLAVALAGLVALALVRRRPRAAAVLAAAFTAAAFTAAALAPQLTGGLMDRPAALLAAAAVALPPASAAVVLLGRRDPADTSREPASTTGPAALALSAAAVAFAAVYLSLVYGGLITPGAIRREAVPVDGLFWLLLAAVLALCGGLLMADRLLAGVGLTAAAALVGGLLLVASLRAETSWLEAASPSLALSLAVAVPWVLLCGLAAALGFWRWRRWASAAR